MAIRHDLRDELMKLSPKERLELADELYSSVPDEVDDADWDQAWADEIRRRIEDIRAGRVQGIPVDEAFDGIRARLAARRR